MRSTLRLLLALAGSVIPGTLVAQTFLGNGLNLLNGVHNASTFEVSGTAAPSTLGWTVLTGANVAAWDNSVNGLMLNAPPSNGFSPFSVRFVTDASLVANSQYTLSFRMGYVSGSGNAGAANFEFRLGTINGGVFTPLNTDSGTVTTSTNFGSSGANSVTRSLTFTTGASGFSGDALAIEWAQTNTPAGTTADYFGFDNVMLSFTAVPEPSTYAAIVGAVALGGAMWRRRVGRRERG